MYIYGEKLTVLHPSFVRFSNVSPGSNWLQDGPTLLPLSLALSYLSELLVPYHQSWSLQSAYSALLSVPPNKKFGRNSFSFSGPTIWKSLPPSFRAVPTFEVFKSGLKTLKKILHNLAQYSFAHFSVLQSWCLRTVCWCLCLYGRLPFIVVYVQRIVLVSTWRNVLHKSDNDTDDDDSDDADVYISIYTRANSVSLCLFLSHHCLLLCQEITS